MSDTAIENCTHDCSTCGANCSSRETNPADMIDKLHPSASVKKVIAVVSGKGGVGKSMVTSLLALAMARRGKEVGILDADITGPSIPAVFGVHSKALGTQDGILPTITSSGLQIMSINLLLEKETDAVVWRGPVIANVVRQFWTDVLWHDVDYLFVDMPPGTGDVPLTVFQNLPIDGIVVVASPQELVRMVVSKSVNMANLMNIPILGLVENMSYYVCPDCGKEHKIFGDSHIDEIADEFNLDVLAQLPLDPSITSAADKGEIEKWTGSILDVAAEVIDRKTNL